MNVKFNPITFAFDIVEQAYPDLKFEFNFAYLGDESIDPKNYPGPWGSADFDNDIPVVLVDPRVPMCAFGEVLLHEVAHVVTGFEAGHNEDWRNEFDKLHQLYNDTFMKLYADPNA